MDPRSHLFTSRWLNVGVSNARSLRRLSNLESDLLNEQGSLIDRLRFRLMHCSPELRQALFQLLGQYFVLRHLCPPHIFNPSLLASLEPSRRGEAIVEARRLLDEELDLAMSKMNLDAVLNNRKSKLVMDVASVIGLELEKELQQRLQRSNKIRVKKRKDNRRKDKIIELEDTSKEREVFVQEILQEMLDKRRDSHLEQMVLTQLRTRILILAPSFRKAIVGLMYFREESEILQRNQAKFEQVVQQRTDQLNISDINNWSGKGAIDVSVLLAFERSQNLQKQLDNNISNELGQNLDKKLDYCTNVLTIHHFVKNYESNNDNNVDSNLIFWLVRMHASLPSSKSAIECAFYFGQFEKQALHANLFEMAEHTFARLQTLEPELSLHLNSSLLMNLEPDPTLFSPDILAPYKSESEELLRRFLERREVSQLNDLQRLADLRLFIRKWIAEIFVCILDESNANLVFDTLLLHRFQSHIFEKVCLALFHLLKPSLLRANDHLRVRELLLGSETIDMRDLRRVLKHLVGEGEYSEIPERPSVPEVLLTPASPGTERREAEAKHRRIDALNQSMHLLYAE